MRTANSANGPDLLSVGVPQDVTSHNVDQVGLWVDFTHETTEPPPEPEQRHTESRLQV